MWLDSGYENKKELEEAIGKAVQQAFDALKDQHGEIDLKLRAKLCEENILNGSKVFSIRSHPSDEVDRLEGDIEKTRVGEKGKVYAKSLLRDDRIPGTCDLEGLKKIFDEGLHLDTLVEFLTRRQWARQDIAEKRKLLEAGCNGIKEWSEEVGGAARLADRVGKLKSGEKWLYMGRYGQPQSLWHVASLFLKQLPPKVWEAIPDNIAKHLKEGDLEGIVSLVEIALSSQLKEGKKGIETLLESVDTSRIDWLFKDPKVLDDKMRGWFESGALASVAEFIPDGPLREILLCLSEHGSLLKSKTARDIFMLERKEDLKDFLKGRQNEISQEIGGGMESVIDNVAESIPVELQELLNLKLENGQFWIEFEREKKDQTFAVLVYPSGLALHRHRKDGEGNVQWPLRLEGINPKSSMKSSLRGFCIFIISHRCV